MSRPQSTTSSSHTGDWRRYAFREVEIINSVGVGNSRQSNKIDLILGYRVPPRRCTAAGSLRSRRRIRCARHWCGHWALGIPVRSAAEKVFEWRHWMILSSTTVLKCVFHETGPRNQLSPVHWILLSQLKASIINGCYRAADYTVARCPSVHLYVCHTPVYSIETAKHVIRLFSPSGSHTIGLVFKRLTLR